MNLFMIFSKWSTSTIGKFWLFSMKFMHTFVSSQQKFVNGFIHFKLIVSNVIKIVECCLIEFLIFNESGFFCHKQQKLIKILIFFFLVFLTFEFLVTCIFLATDAITFHCFYIIYFTELSELFISLLISINSLNTLFTETNSSSLIYESIN